MDAKKELIIRKGKLIFLLDNIKKTAGVLNNDYSSGDVIIPRSITYNMEEFVITSILKGSFMDSPVTSISFSSDSELRTIEEKAFQNSNIQKIEIPPSVTELKDMWCYKMNYLCSVNVDQRNPHFKLYNDEFILGKFDSKSDEFDTIIFALQNSKKTIIIPPFVKKISPCSFANTNIEKVFLSPHVLEIGEYAFFQCCSLTKLEIPFDSELRTIGICAFNYTSLSELTIPPKVIEFKDSWHSVKAVTLMPNSCHFKDYEGQMILGKTDPKSDEFNSIIFVKKGIETITIPPFITTISLSAFSSTLITKIAIPPSVEEICEKAFDSINILAEVVIPEDSKLRIIGRKAFYYTSIKKIFIPRHIKEICSQAFYLCRCLETIEIAPYSELQAIGTEAFACTKIKNLSLPSTVSRLEKGWVWGFENMEQLTIASSNPHFKKFGDMILGKTNDESDEFDKIIFAQRYVKKVTIPPFIKEIDAYAFAQTKLRSIFIPKQIIKIHQAAFDQCKSLLNVEFEENSNLQVIGKYAFLLTQIKKIIIPPSVTKIGDRAFFMCNVENVDISPNSKLQEIGKEAFSESRIQSFCFQKQIRFIGLKVFYLCHLQVIEFEDGSSRELCMNALRDFEGIVHCNAPLPLV